LDLCQLWQVQRGGLGSLLELRKEMTIMMRDGCWHMKTGDCDICNKGG
jgi:hypothetical protein